MPEGSGENPYPYIKSGIDKGRIKDPLVAQETYNTLEAERRRKKIPKSLKPNFFSNNGEDDRLIRASAKIVKLENEKSMDPLTGLFRQEAYVQYVKDSINAVRKGEFNSLGVARVDFDYFSWVNDFLGAHHLGDIYIGVAGHMLSTVIKSAKDKAFRPGGDELAVVIRDSFSQEQFTSTIQRYHDTLNGKILPKVINILSNTSEKVENDDGRLEREGTVAMKEFLRGLGNLRDNVPNEKGVGMRDYFLSNARGTDKIKHGFLEKLYQIDFKQYQEYIDDRRTIEDIKDIPEEVESRNQIEGKIARDIEYLLPNLTVSTGGVFMTKENIKDYRQVNNKCDSLVKALKSKGGGVSEVTTFEKASASTN